MRIPESELIINDDGSCFHLHMKPEELADNIILVGDQNRVALAAKNLSNIEFHREAREFHSTTGWFNDKRVSIISTGIGTDNCDIVMNEIDALANIDFKTREVKEEKRHLNILRVGTSGSIQPDVPVGSNVFSEMSIGCDGLMNWYAGREEIVEQGITEAFKKSVGWDKHLCDPYFVKSGTDMTERFKDCAILGCTISAQGFYGPQGRVLRLPLAMPDMVEKFTGFEYEGHKIVNFEMEGSAIAGLGKLLGHNCGTVCCIIAQRNSHGANTNYRSSVEDLLRLAIERLTL